MAHTREKLQILKTRNTTNKLNTFQVGKQKIATKSIATPEVLLDINGITARTNRAHRCHFGVARHFRYGKFVLQHFLFALCVLFACIFIFVAFLIRNTLSLLNVFMCHFCIWSVHRINFVVRNVKTYLSDAVFKYIQ